MKKLFFISLAAIAMIVCMASCGGSKPTPSSIAQDCIEYMKNGDYKAFVETLNANDEQKAQLQMSANYTNYASYNVKTYLDGVNDV